MDHNKLYVQVTAVLVDGGLAINTAFSRSSKDHGEGFKIWLRCCFAHVIRMGMTHGGGKRGVICSLPCYLLHHKVPPKAMGKNDVHHYLVQLYSR